MKTIKYLLISVLLAGFSTTANAQKTELNAALDAIKSKSPNTPELVKTAYKKNKNNPEALVNIGRAYFEQKDAAGAILFANYANEASKPKYQYAPAYLLLGDVETAFGNDGGKAAGYYNQAINFDPKNPEGYKKWAKVYYKINPNQAAAKLNEMKRNCPDEDVDAIAAQIFTQGDNVKNTETNTNKLDEIINLIKQGYVDPSFTKLCTVNTSDKVYMFQDEENVAVQGRACWKTDMEYILLGTDNSMGIISASTIDLIAPNGGHGERIHKIGPKGIECRFILVKGIIYKWEKEDYSDLQKYLIFDSNNNILMSVDKKKKYNPINKNEL